jgi:hypothetical protein
MKGFCFWWVRDKTGWKLRLIVFLLLNTVLCFFAKKNTMLKYL